MTRPKKPQVTTLDKVTITREGDTAVIDYLDPTIGGVNLTIGPSLKLMSDQEVLDCHNGILMERDRFAANYHHEALEIPPGKPQVKYFDKGDQWVPRGGVLRCVIHDDEHLQAVIEIDDREFTLEEFGRMLTTYAGWGMRIVFVPDDDLEKEPTIVIGEPEESTASDTSYLD